MAQRTLSCMLASSALIVIGVAILTNAISYGHKPPSPEPPLINTIISGIMALIPGPLVGAGIANFFHRAGLGAIIGIVAWGGFIVMAMAMSHGI